MCFMGIEGNICLSISDVSLFQRRGGTYPIGYNPNSAGLPCVCKQVLYLIGNTGTCNKAPIFVARLGHLIQLETRQRLSGEIIATSRDSGGHGRCD